LLRCHALLVHASATDTLKDGSGCGSGSRMPPKKKQRQAKSWTRVDVGACGLQGERPTMEDAHFAAPAFITSSAKLDDLQATKAAPLHCFGVFDGHGGDACAAFAATELPEQLKSALAARLPAVAALVNAHQATDVQWFRSPARDMSGTTAVTVLLESSSGRVLAANAGDSRAIIVRGKRAIALTTDQDADNKAEKKRLKAVGAEVDDDGYINDSVQVARSIGDWDAKFVEGEDDDGDPQLQHSMAVVATPDCKWGFLEPDDILVLCCDGVIEPTHPSAAWIAKHVRAAMTSGSSAQEAAEGLAREALSMGSEDNVSVLVVAPLG
jgi:protein phosphatase 2C family protein 2/3